MTESDRTLTVEEAARVLFSTADPTDQQVGRVRHLLVRGKLQQGSKGRWSTTAQSVAELLARNAVRKQSAGRQFDEDGMSRAATTPATRKAKSGNRSRPGANGDLSSFYGELLRDYFLAVTLRRRNPQRSASFARAVLGGQIVLLVAAAGLFVLCARQVFAPPPPEQPIVEQWLEEKAEEYQIVQWFPAKPLPSVDGMTVRVRYKYFSGRRKGIITDRVFRIEGGKVTSVTHFE